MVSARDRVLFGAAYYHEYQPSPRLDTDLDLMAEAGFFSDQSRGVGVDHLGTRGGAV
jgi:hypothetical protein